MFKTNIIQNKVFASINSIFKIIPFYINSVYNQMLSSRSRKLLFKFNFTFFACFSEKIYNNHIIQEQTQKLVNLIVHLNTNHDRYLAPIRHPLHNANLLYPAFLVKSCVICDIVANNIQDLQMKGKYGFRILKQQIKLNILQQNQENSDKSAEDREKERIRLISEKLTPLSCAIIMQILPLFKFQGDEGSLIDIFCCYYENNAHRFTKQQEQVFWNSYMRLMTQKIHEKGPLKFKKLQRAEKTRQNSQIAEVIKNQIKKGTLKPNKAITEISGIKDDHILELKLIVPVQGKKRKIALRIMPIVNPGELPEKDRKKVESKVITQIFDIEKACKKGWKIVIHNNIRNKNLYSNQEMINQVPNGRISADSIEKFYQNSQYINGILYNNQNKNDQKIISPLLTLTKKYANDPYTQNQQYLFTKTELARGTKLHQKNIEHALTLLMGINPLYTKKGMISLMNFNSNKKYTHQEKSPHDAVLQYLSTYEIKECAGYAEMFQLHFKIFETYLNLQALVNKDRRQEKQQVFKSVLGEDFDSDDTQDRSKKKVTKLGASILADYTIEKSKKMGEWSFDNKYYENKNQSGLKNGELIGDVYWMLSKLFPDCKIIFEELIKIIEGQIKEKEKEEEDKQYKFVVITHEDNAQQLARNMIQAKFLSVPVLKKQTGDDSSEAKLRKKLSQFLLKEIY